jgi:hypothetical protein
MGTEIFGFVAVTVMLVAYALEQRGAAFVLLFAVGCAGAASYAAVIKSYPFAGVEAVWCAIALRRWHARRASAYPHRDAGTTSRP